MGCTNSTSALLTCTVKTGFNNASIHPYFANNLTFQQNMATLTKDHKKKQSLAQKLISAIQNGNLNKVKAVIKDAGGTLDFTDVHGFQSTLSVDDNLSFQTELFTPVLLALTFNKLDIVRYFLEDLNLSLPLYLHKPRDQSDTQIVDHLRKHPEERRDTKSLQKKQERYNRIISIIIACKHRNRAMLAYLLGFEKYENKTDAPQVNVQEYEQSSLVRRQLRHFWAKKDLSAMLHFITNHIKIWKFALPVIFESHVAHRWFYQERDFNKVDIIYRIQRHFNVKIILAEMFHQLYEQLAMQPYAASFFYAYVNQEYLDDQVPEISVLRQALNSVQKFDFAMLHNEFRHITRLRDEILKRFPNVTSYREILNQYCKQIESFQSEWVPIQNDLEQLTSATMAEDIPRLQYHLNKLGIKSVNQVSLQVEMLDGRFPATNLLTVSLHHAKPSVVNFLLDNDMIDISNCCRRPLASNVTNYMLPKFTNPGGTITTNKTNTGQKSTLGITGGESPVDFDKAANNYFTGSPSKTSLQTNFKVIPSSTFQQQILQKRSQKTKHSQYLNESHALSEYTDSTPIRFKTPINAPSLIDANHQPLSTDQNFQSVAALLKPPVGNGSKMTNYHIEDEKDDKPYFQPDEEDIVQEGTNQMLLPFEVLIEQRHQDLFLKCWDIFAYRFKYSEFVRILSLLLGDINAKEWITHFLERQTTKNFFENLHVRNQMDFISRLLSAFDLHNQKTRIPNEEIPQDDTKQATVDKKQFEQSIQPIFTKAVSGNNILDASNAEDLINELELDKDLNEREIENEFKTYKIPIMNTNNIQVMDIDSSFLSPEPKGGIRPQLDTQGDLLIQTHGVMSKSSSKVLLANPMIFVAYSSPPAKKERKMPLKPLIIEMRTMHLLKPATLEILGTAPYVSAVFLHCFISKQISEEDEKRRCDERILSEHIAKGYALVSYRQKLEMCLEFTDNLFQDHGFRNRIMEKMNPLVQSLQPPPTRTLSMKSPEQTPNPEFNLDPISLIKTYSTPQQEQGPAGNTIDHKNQSVAFQPPISHSNNIVQKSKTSLFKQVNSSLMITPSQIDRIYSLFYTAMISQDFLLPHMKDFLKIEALEL